MRTPRAITLGLIAAGVVLASSLAIRWRVRGADEALGRITLPNSGAPAAQPHFLRGVAALHSFWYDEAQRCFRAALRHDPAFALAFWGLAMTHRRPFMPGSDDAAARKELGALPPRAQMTARERGYVDALWAWLAAGTPEDRARAHAAAWRRLHEQDPDDLEAAAFYALSLLGPAWPDDAEAPVRRRTAATVSESILRRESRHPGAAHYLIHSCDLPELAARGLPAARLYAAIAPESSHARHMPSHIFLHLGLWREVTAANESAWAASEAWVRAGGLSPTLRDYHNLHWLIYSRLQEGQFARAAELLTGFRAMRPDMLPEHQFFYEKAAAAYIVETGRWDQAEAVFAAPERPAAPAPAAVPPPSGVEWCGLDSVRPVSPPGLQPADIPAFITTLAAAVRETPEAEGRLARLKAAAGGDAAMPEFWRIRVLAIRGVGEAQRHRYDAAISALREATRIEEELGIPAGPPAAYKPPHELLGEVLLRAGRPAEAVEPFETCLRRHPGRARSLLGLARARRMLGDHPAARRIYGTLLTQWTQADAGLDEVREARDYVRSREG